jgi:chromosome segregation ATPase
VGINDPLGRIEALEAEQKQLKEEVRKLKEQQTEPIHVTVERRQTEVERTQELHTAMLQEISTKQDEQGRQLEVLMHQSIKTQTDIATLRTDMQKRFDAIADVQMLILERLPEKGE